MIMIMASVFLLTNKYNFKRQLLIFLSYFDRIKFSAKFGLLCKQILCKINVRVSIVYRSILLMFIEVFQNEIFEYKGRG